MANNTIKDNNNKIIKEKRIFVFDAIPGMVLSRDANTSKGHLVAPRGSIIDIDLMAKISGYHILEIYVLDKPLEPITPVKSESESIPDHPTYFDKIRSSKEFKVFQTEYNEAVTDLKNKLNKYSDNSESIDTNSLLEESLLVMSKHSNNLHMFDMLHSLRHHGDMTYAHSVNVALIASIIGQWLHYSAEDIKLLTLSGLLHDIGKLSIDESILNKPGKLTPDEFDIIKGHVKAGYNTIKDQELDDRVKEACLLHHEKCDGSGYPFGLKSNQIPDFAKIVTIADIYDAMTANRVYRGAVCPFEVIRIIEQDAFSKLDPAFALPFLKNVVSSYIHTNVKLSNGKYGEVILINDRDLSRPTVKCGNEFIDLSKTPGVTITAIL